MGRTVAGSEPWWPPRAEPPAGAPNVLVILIDDLGYSDLGCYGSEIGTPNVDALAARGLRYTNFHVTPMCSPTRSALLTGLNSHRAGVGHVAHSDPGFPGYAMELTEHAATAAEIYRDAGWATFMAGKWHLAKDSDTNAAGSQHSWPCQRGFERFYGILDGFTNLHHPHRLMSDNQVVEVDRYPDGYYLTDDLTDRCLSWWKELRASHPRKPWFTYLAHPAVPRPAARQAGRHRALPGPLRGGLGRAAGRALRPPAGAGHRRRGHRGRRPATPRRATTSGPGTSWRDHEQELFARHMEVYAGMVDGLDQIDRPPARRPGRDGRAGQHDRRVHLRQRGVPGGRGGGHQRLLRPPAGPARRRRPTSPASTCWAGPRPCPTTPGAGPWRRTPPSASTRSTPTPGGHSVPFVLSWPDRLAPRTASCGASTPTWSTCCPRCWS